MNSKGINFTVDFEVKRQLDVLLANKTLTIKSVMMAFIKKLIMCPNSTLKFIGISATKEEIL